MFWQRTVCQTNKFFHYERVYEQDLPEDGGGVNQVVGLRLFGVINLYFVPICL